MKKLFLIVLGTGLLIGSCKKSQTAAASDSSDAPAAPVVQKTEPVIVFEKTPCFGTCPIYKAEIYEDGMMNYNGKRFVELVGEYKLNIGKDWVKEMLKQAEEINYFEMEDKYDGNVTDLPSTVTTINYRKQNKSIKARYNIPADLKTFNKTIHDKIMELIKGNAERLEKNKMLRESKKRELQKRPPDRFNDQR